MSRELPNAIEAEKSVLCAALNATDWTLDAALSHGVSADSFYLDAHQTVWQTLVEMREEGKTIDTITVVQRLKDKGKLESVGGFPAMSALAMYQPTFVNTTAYLDEIAEKATRRKMYVLCMNAAQEAVGTEKRVHEALDGLAGAVAELSTGKKIADVKTIRDDVMDKLNRMSTGEPKADIIVTGIDGLDRHSPLNRGDMPAISGEKKAGKSMLALTILSHIALETGLPTVYFSLEDRTRAVIDRLVASVSRVPTWQHYAGELVQSSFTALQHACVTLGKSKIYVRDNIQDLHAIVAFIRRLKSKEPNLACAIVDYAQLVRAKEGKSDSREQEVARISRTLRLLAMELGIAIILLCQLNKDGVTRESAAIEMDVTAMWKVCNGKEKGTKVVAIPFQRNGASGIAFPMTFMGDICRFENMATTDIEDMESLTEPAPQKSAKRKPNP